MDTDLLEPVAFLCLDDLDDLEQLVEEVLLSGDRRAPQLVLLPALSTHTHAGRQWREGGGGGGGHDHPVIYWRSNAYTIGSF